MEVTGIASPLTSTVIEEGFAAAGKLPDEPPPLPGATFTG